jgi:hypothetical protein
MQIACEPSANSPAHYLQVSQKPWGGVPTWQKAITWNRELLPATFE